MKRFTVAGWPNCGAYKKARDAIKGLSAIFPGKITANIIEHADRDAYILWLEAERASFGVPEHKTSPLCWLTDENNAPILPVVGGRDDAIAWCQKFVSVDDDADAGSTANLMANVDPWKAEHGFDYDLVVIGGGSGGLATGREAAKLGAKVAILDFVKPSPAGSKWGIGGTCVNVGCIPKKLMHNAALLGEHAAASNSYGWNIGMPEGVTPGHDWDTLKNNVQDHIKGLNFGYRVSLREEGITYLNKLGKFIDEHTLECTDSKGRTANVTGARFVVAVGGRPTPLSCPGGEFAITSDDLFMKKEAPGKTCVVGAGYVALECAGFITGLKQGEVTVLVRSMLLRGFDRDIVDKVQQVMEHSGTKIKTGVLPESIAKQDNGKLLVTFTNGESDEFDTVLAAVGRKMDLEGLGIGSDSAVPLSVAKNGKLVCNNEQTNVPHVYAVGDIVDGAPELTPVAIAAGQLLARRLFGEKDDKKVAMVYKNVATTVFTPLELGTVGLTEDEAIAQYGEASIDCFVSSFQPLEWSIIQDFADLRCLAKVVVDKTANDKVLGIHIAAPNAGEIIQGFGVAFRKGLTHKDLTDTIGIHPTTAEEIVGATISKSSGEGFEKQGC